MMRRTRVAAALLAVVALGLTAAAAVAVTPTLLTGTVREFQVKPSEIVYTGDGSGLLAGRGTSRRTRRFGRIHWTSWNSRTGRGWGGNWLDDCAPDCARGTFTAYPVNLKVYRPRVLAGHRLFTRLQVTYTGRRPSFVHTRSQTWPLVDRRSSFFWCFSSPC